MLVPRQFVLAACSASLIASCATYKPQAISPAENAAALESRNLDDPRLRQFVGFGLSQATDAHGTGSWDLGALTLAAVYYHPDIDVARAKFETARAGVLTARQVPNPTLGVGLTYNSSVTTPSPWTIAPVISFILETFGKREYRTAQAQALVQAAREDLATAGWQVRGKIRAALLNVWAADRRLEYARRRLGLQDQLAGLLERRFAVGEASSLDVTRERINRNQASLAVRDAERQSADARVQLATAIGIPVRALEGVTLSLDVFDKPVPVAPDVTPGTLRQRALVKRTDVQALLAEYEAAQSALRLQIANQFPNLTLGPGYAYDQGDHKYNLNVSAELPVFHQNQGPIAEAQARRKEAAARVDALQAQIIGAIDSAAANYRSAAEALSTADALLEGAQARERQVSRSFDAGQSDRPTLVTAQIELATIQASRLDALAQQRQSLGALEDALQEPLFEPGR